MNFISRLTDCAAFCRFDNEGRCIDVAPSVKETPAIKRDIIGKHISEIFPEDVSKKLLMSFKEISSSFTSKRIDCQIKDASEIIYLEIHIFPDQNNNLLVFFHDVTKHKKNEETIENHKPLLIEYSQLISIFEAVEHIVYVTDMDTYKILYVNKTIRDMYHNRPLIGKLCYKEFQGFDTPCPFCTNSIIRNNNGQPYYWEHYNKKLKAYYHITDKVIKWPPDNKDVRFELAIDITRYKLLEEKLQKIAITDELTGIWNRRYFLQQGKQQFQFSHRYKIPFSLLILDIDHFKNINDRYGHLVGDKVMKQTVTTILKNLREADILCRIGGDEFGLLLPHTDLSGALLIAERLRSSISKAAIKYLKDTFSITGSIGVANYSKKFKSFSEMFKRADIALYEAKGRGRNMVSYKPLRTIHPKRKR